MYNRNRGYVGNSRSVRSEFAIMNNEVPMNMINMDKLGQVAEEIEIPEVMEKVKLLTLAKFKTWISPSSWHHTGSYFNETNHYDLESNLLELNELSKHDIIELNNRICIPKKNTDITYGYAVVQVWGGTRSRPKLLGDELQVGYIKGDYLHNKHGKKFKLSANKCLSYKKFEDWKLAKKYINSNFDKKVLKEDFPSPNEKIKKKPKIKM